jgi:transposase
MSMRRSWHVTPDLNPEILRPIAHRTVEQQEALTLIRALNLVVPLRTAAVNGVRGLTKSCGHRMPESTTPTFAKRRLSDATRAGLTASTCRRADRRDDTQDLAVRPLDPATRSGAVSGDTGVVEIHGVGHLMALTFVLTLGSKELRSW